MSTQPCSEVLAKGSTTVADGKGTYLVENTGEQVGVLVARALVEPKGNGVPVNLLISGWK